MKPQHSLLWVSLTAIHALSSLQPSWGAYKGETSGGGDEYTHDFVQTVTNEIAPLLRAQANAQRGFNADDLLKAADPRRMVSQDKVYESCDDSNTGREVEACYSAITDLFYISRTKYPLHRANSPAKRALITHELFRKMGLEGDGYEVTRTINFFSPRTQSMDYEAMNSNEQYLREFPSLGVDQVVLNSAWYRVDGGGNVKAKAEVLRFLKDNLKTGARKDLMEQLIEYENKTGCDKNKDYLKYKERNTSSGSYSYDNSTYEGSSASASASTRRSRASSSASSSYSERDSGAGSYYEDTQIEERDVYCERPSQWVRAVLKATTKIQVLAPQDQAFFISRHVQRTFESLSQSSGSFLDGIDNIILMPAITPYALKSKYQRSGSTLLQSWVSRKLGKIESGKQYVALLRKLFNNFEYEASASQFESQVEAIAERASQVENPGVYALISNEEGSAQPVLILSDKQLKKISPSHSFQGVAQNKSRLTPQFVSEWEKNFKCDIGYMTLYDAVKNDPASSFVANAARAAEAADLLYPSHHTELAPLMTMANVALSCSGRYSYVEAIKSTGPTFRYPYDHKPELSSATSQLIGDFNSRGCIPVSFNCAFAEAVIYSICPIAAAARQ